MFYRPLIKMKVSCVSVFRCDLSDDDTLHNGHVTNRRKSRSMSPVLTLNDNCTHLWQARSLIVMLFYVSSIIKLYWTLMDQLLGSRWCQTGLCVALNFLWAGKQTQPAAQSTLRPHCWIIIIEELKCIFTSAAREDGCYHQWLLILFHY